MEQNMDTVDAVQFHKNLAESYRRMMVQAIHDGSGARVVKYRKLVDEQTAIADSLEWERIVRIADTVAKEHGSQPVQLRSGATDQMEIRNLHTRDVEMVPIVVTGSGSTANGFHIPAGHYKSIEIDGKGAPKVTRMDGTTFRAKHGIRAESVGTLTIGSDETRTIPIPVEVDSIRDNKNNTP
jgi:hypothetical protein